MQIQPAVLSDHVTLIVMGEDSQKSMPLFLKMFTSVLCRQNLHRADPEGEGQRRHDQRGDPPQQGGHRQAENGLGQEEHP